MRIPDINRLRKAEEFLNRVINEFNKVYDNPKNANTQAYDELTGYFDVVLKLRRDLRGTIEREWEEYPEETKNKYINK